MRIFYLTLALISLFFTALPINHAKAASEEQLMNTIAQSCPKNWETPACLRTVSYAALMLSSTYAATLKHKGNPGSVEKVKQHCAASTAMTKEDFPAYAMQSAFTECVNMIHDIAEATGIAPNPTHYQMVVFPIICLSKSPQCRQIEAGLIQR